MPAVTSGRGRGFGGRGGEESPGTGGVPVLVLGDGYKDTCYCNNVLSCTRTCYALFCVWYASQGKYLNRRIKGYSRDELDTYYAPSTAALRF